MKKRQTIFKKYLYISMLVFFAGLLILGVMIVFFVTQYWENDRWESMKKSATAISVSVTDNAAPDNDKITFGKEDEIAIKTTINMMADSLNSDIIVTDLQGNVLLYSYGKSGIDENTVITMEYVEKAENKELNEITDFAGIYDTPYYVVGVPVQTVGLDGLYSIGAVFVTSSAAHTLVDASVVAAQPWKPGALILEFALPY